MIEKVLMAFLSSLLVENFVLVKFLGICPFLGVSKKINSSFWMGTAVTFVLTIASFFTWFVYKLLVYFNVEYLKIVAFILIIAALVQLVEIAIQKISKALYDTLGVYLPLITTNCAILGLCIINIDLNRGLFDSVMYGTFSGLGFTLAIVIFAGIRERLELSNIPESLKGFPISLISASIVSLSFFGFQGII